MGTQVAPPTQRLFWQVQSLAQAGQAIFPPQASPIVPQYWPPGGVHVTFPQSTDAPSGDLASRAITGANPESGIAVALSPPAAFAS
jgi:hypothetical protein